MTTPPFPDMDDLVQRLLDDQIQPEEMARLQTAILQDPQVRDYYINSLLACAVIRRSSLVTGDLSESDLIRAISDRDSQPAARRLVRPICSIAAVLVLAVLILASLSLFHRGPQGPAIGRLTSVYQARWDGPHPRPGQPLYPGSYHLREGLARLELGQGSDILLQAPCGVELQGVNEMTLTSGRLTAVVSPQARGFQVQTPTALITDLGTKFGVLADPNGKTEAHVLTGRISVALDPNRSDRTAPLVVGEGLAAVVDASGRTIQAGLPVQEGRFFWDLPQTDQPASPGGRLSLADLVGGGNGYGTGTLDQGIDLMTGHPFNGPLSAVRHAQRNEFRPLPRFRAIDGVFVPNGSHGPVVISSTGLTFDQCPATAGTYYGGLANSGKVISIQTRRVYTARLNGTEYGTLRHPALNLHPNAGITFDLDRMRAENPGVRIERFTAVCGISENIPLTRANAADAWVLVDGGIRFHQHYPKDQNPSGKVNVPIAAEARFLTLVTTCPGNTGFSWIFFGDPLLELSVKE
jgi:hypothetical protein